LRSGHRVYTPSPIAEVSPRESGLLVAVGDRHEGHRSTTAGLQDASDLAQVVLDIGQLHVHEDPERTCEVELIVLIGEPNVRGTGRAIQQLVRVGGVDEVEAEVRSSCRCTSPRTPLASGPTA
jgi:hypothetical protein